MPGLDTHPPELRRVRGHGGMPIAVWDYGGAGPPLLLCHCTGAAARVWDPVAAPLRNHYHVYALDNRGHGDSGRPRSREDCAWEFSGRDLLAAAGELGLGDGLYAAGHSGGAAQVGYAALYRPALFTRIALIDGIIGPRRFFLEPPPLAEQARRRRARFENRAAARNRLAAKPPMSHWHPDALNAYISHALRETGHTGAELKCPPGVEAWMYEMGGACDLFERMHEIAAELLLVTGNDPKINAVVRAQHAKLKRAELRVWHDTGHFIPQERPERTAALLAEWFG